MTCIVASSNQTPEHFQDKRLFFLLNMAQHHAFAYAKQQCTEKLGITVTQAGALLYIAKHEGCVQKELAQALGLKKSAVTGLVTRMQNNALITRRVSEVDARASQLYLTRLGKEKIPQILPIIQEANASFVADFSEEEISVIVRFLKKVINDFGHETSA